MRQKRQRNKRRRPRKTEKWALESTPQAHLLSAEFCTSSCVIATNTFGGAGKFLEKSTCWLKLRSPVTKEMRKRKGEKRMGRKKEREKRSEKKEKKGRANNTEGKTSTEEKRGEKEEKKRREGGTERK